MIVAVRIEPDVQPRRRAGHGRFVVEGDAVAERRQADEAVQRAAVEEVPAEFAREETADRPLPGAPGAVDRDDGDVVNRGQSKISISGFKSGSE